MAVSDDLWKFLIHCILLFFYKSEVVASRLCLAAKQSWIIGAALPVALRARSNDGQGCAVLACGRAKVLDTRIEVNGGALDVASICTARACSSHSTPRPSRRCASLRRWEWLGQIAHAERRKPQAESKRGPRNRSWAHYERSPWNMATQLAWKHQRHACEDSGRSIIVFHALLDARRASRQGSSNPSRSRHLSRKGTFGHVTLHYTAPCDSVPRESAQYLMVDATRAIMRSGSRPFEWRTILDIEGRASPRDGWRKFGGNAPRTPGQVDNQTLLERAPI